MIWGVMFLAITIQAAIEANLVAFAFCAFMALAYIYFALTVD
jgi:hypothetical protein